MIYRRGERNISVLRGKWLQSANFDLLIKQLTKLIFKQGAQTLTKRSKHYDNYS